MLVGPDQTCPVPADPVLAEWAAALSDAGDWGWVVDAQWRLVYMTDEQRLSFAAGIERVPIAIGEHVFGPTLVALAADWRTGPTMARSWRELLGNAGGLVLADTPGGRAELESLVDPSLADIVDGLSPSTASVVTGQQTAAAVVGEGAPVVAKILRVRDTDGDLRGSVILYQPEVGMGILGSMAYERDLGHLDRLRAVARARRRPAAILFGDLEGSSALSRRLSTSNYFSTVRRVVRATDQCVVDAGGVVGRHVGDGVVAFFPVEVFESESAAARACVTAARDIESAMKGVAERCGLPADQLSMRFGLHWGSTVYMGNISTAARSEVTALGDEVNEAARIEACASGGRTLASKPLVERLSDDDAHTLEVDPDEAVYTQLADLATATDKARRDAPAIAVCDLTRS